MELVCNNYCKNALYRLYDVAFVYIGQKPNIKNMTLMRVKSLKVNKNTLYVALISEISYFNYKIFLTNKEISIHHYRRIVHLYAVFLAALSFLAYRYQKFVFTFFMVNTCLLKLHTIPKKSCAP